MRFHALELSLDLIRSLRQPLRRLAQRDAQLDRQIRAAASSVALNLGEGSRRAGKDRRYHFRVASGSANEVRTALRVGEAWGHLERADTARPLEILDRLLGMLWGLAK